MGCGWDEAGYALCEHGRDDFAWSAPCCPEVDGYEGIVLGEDFGEGFFAFKHGYSHDGLCKKWMVR